MIISSRRQRASSLEKPRDIVESDSYLLYHWFARVSKGPVSWQTGGRAVLRGRASSLKRLLKTIERGEQEREDTIEVLANKVSK